MGPGKVAGTQKGPVYLPSNLQPYESRKKSIHPIPADKIKGVAYRVPQDYATIQSAIDACADGDTVLVSEGTYLENIRYRGKAIVVGSLYLVDGDTTHIEKTIIDGSGSTDPDSGSVVYFVDGGHDFCTVWIDHPGRKQGPVTALAILTWWEEEFFVMHPEPG